MRNTCTAHLPGARSQARSERRGAAPCALGPRRRAQGARTPDDDSSRAIGPPARRRLAPPRAEALNPKSLVRAGARRSRVREASRTSGCGRWPAAPPSCRLRHLVNLAQVLSPADRSPHACNLRHDRHCPRLRARSGLQFRGEAGESHSDMKTMPDPSGDVLEVRRPKEEPQQHEYGRVPADQGVGMFHEQKDVGLP